MFLGALALYWLTLSPGLLPADAGEFQLVAARLGIAHPPGYPLYTLIGGLFAHLMPANLPRALNLFSAVTMALAVMLAGRAARRFSGSAWGGVVASSALMVAASVWSTATQASIRPLAAFFMALCLERLAAYRNRSDLRQPDRALTGFALAFGLGLAHHPSLAFPGIVFAIYLLLIEPRLAIQPRRWVAPLGAFTLGFLPWLYLPIRGAMPDVPFAPEGIATWRGFWDHVLARGFAGDFFYFHTPTELWDRTLIWLNILQLQWGDTLLILAGVAAVVLALRDWRVLILLGGAFGVHSLVTMTYRAPQTVEYLIPAYVALAVLVGIGLSPYIPRMSIKIINPRNLWTLLPALAITASLVHLFRQYPSYAWLARDHSTRETSEALLDAAPPGAVILASWHWATPLQALQQIDGVRPDVEVIYVYPEGAEPLAQTWVRRIEALLVERPVVVTSFYPPEFAATPYFFEPVDGGWRVRASPRRDLPEGMTTLNWRLDNGLTAIGYEIASEPAVGETFEVRIAWRIDAPMQEDVTGSVSLNNSSIAIHNGDVLIPTSRAEVGDVLVTRHVLGMPPYGLPSPQDQYWLLLSAYTFGPDGGPQNLASAGRFLFTTLAEATIAPPEWPAPAACEGWQDCTSLGGEMILSRVEVSPEGSLQPGDVVIVDLTFLSAQPLLRDYVVKVDLIGEGYAWRAESNHVPATGALPTLKWLVGWEVHDRHRLIVPLDASTTAAHAELVVYDQFTGQALPILDVALSQQGIAVPLYEWR